MLLPERCDDLVTDLLEANAKRLEDAGGDSLAFAHDPKQQVLGANVTVAQLARLVDRELDNSLRPRREGDLAGRCRRIAATDDELDSGARLRELDAERTQDPGGHTVSLADEPEEEMFDPYVVVVETDRLVLREGEHALRAVVEAVEGSHW